MPAVKLVVARENFATTVDGREMLINAGTRVRASHPLAKAHPHLFAPVEPETDLEQTAKRSTRKPRKGQ